MSQTSATGSPLSEYSGENTPTTPVANENGPEPMEEDTGDHQQQDNTEPLVPFVMDVQEIIKSATINLHALEKKYNIAYATYLSCQLLDVAHPSTKTSHDEYLLALQGFTEAKNALVSFKNINCPSKVQDVKKFSLVPKDLPFLQLTANALERKNSEAYDSVYDFCGQFRTVLNAHSLDMNSHWERLFPLCLNKEDRSWFDENLNEKGLPWKEAEAKILDHFDTPYRKFLLMINVHHMRQAPRESTRAYGAKFQKLRRQADMKDGVQLVLMFYCSLCESVKEKASSAIASQYGTKLPNKLEDMILLVSASDSDYLSSGSSGNSSSFGSSSYGNKDNERSFKKRSSSHFDSANKDSSGSKKAYTSASSSRKRPCSYCGKTWFHGHRCEEFKQAQKDKVSRMAMRGGKSPSSSDEDDDMQNVSMAQLALE